MGYVGGVFFGVLKEKRETALVEQVEVSRSGCGLGTVTDA